MACLQRLHWMFGQRNWCNFHFLWIFALSGTIAVTSSRYPTPKFWFTRLCTYFNHKVIFIRRLLNYIFTNMFFYTEPISALISSKQFWNSLSFRSCDLIESTFLTSTFIFSSKFVNGLLYFQCSGFENDLAVFEAEKSKVAQGTRFPLVCMEGAIFFLS